MKPLIIIPAYNEALNIEKTIKDVTTNTNYDYIIINDCSKDNTKQICEDNNFNVISLPINYGLTSGIQVGMKYAYQNNYDYVIQFDADGQHIAKEAMKLYKKMKKTNSDIVIGSRYLKDTGYPCPFFRKMGTKIFSLLISLFTCSIFFSCAAAYCSACFCCGVVIIFVPNNATKSTTNIFISFLGIVNLYSFEISHCCAFCKASSITNFSTFVYSLFCSNNSNAVIKRSLYPNLSAIFAVFCHVTRFKYVTIQEQNKTANITITKNTLSSNKYLHFEIKTYTTEIAVPITEHFKNIFSHNSHTNFIFNFKSLFCSCSILFSPLFFTNILLFYFLFLTGLIKCADNNTNKNETITLNTKFTTQ